MRLTKVEDPRDNLDRADRDQLYRFALARRVRNPDELLRIYNGGDAANLMRLLLRNSGCTDINVPYHQLGMPPYKSMGDEQPSGKPAMTVDELLREQLKEVLAPEPEKPKPKEPDKLVSEMSFLEMRKACKARGIYFSRRDNLQTLREKLSNGQAAS